MIPPAQNVNKYDIILSFPMYSGFICRKTRGPAACPSACRIHPMHVPHSRAKVSSRDPRPLKLYETTERAPRQRTGRRRVGHSYF